METMSQWTFPGSRWWKCDFHVHSPGSDDFVDRNAVTECQWIKGAINAGLHCVAVSDHNTGSYVERIQACLAALPEPKPVLFPAVEIAVTPGVHLLAILDPTRDSAAVTALLGACQMSDTHIGSMNGCSQESVTNVMKIIADRAGVVIAAHADSPKGILSVVQNGQSLQQIILSESLHAVELMDPNSALKRYVDNSIPEYRRIRPLALTLFSDAHEVGKIGCNFTWVKMSKPDLAGLRLALLDGSLSVLRSDEESGDPNKHAPLLIESIEIKESKYIGRGDVLVVQFNPWLNAIIGGRGTGKSSIIEFLRVALRRDDDLPDTIKPDFEAFRRVPRNSDERGVLTENTQLRVVYRKDQARFLIQWDNLGTLEPIQEEQEDGVWTAVAGDIRTRFPVRIYSQKQIYALADSPEALLRIVDEAPDANRGSWNDRWRDEEIHFLALRAKARDVASGLGEEGRLKGELDDVIRRLSIFESAGHTEVLRNYQLRKRQKRAIEEWQESFADVGERLRGVASTTEAGLLDTALFSPAEDADKHVLETVDTFAKRLLAMKDTIEGLAVQADAILQECRDSLSQSPWSNVITQTESAYVSLVERLREVGTDEPSEYGRLVQERQRLEQAISALDGKRRMLEGIQKQSMESMERLKTLRRELTQNRAEFLTAVIGTNPHVRMTVVPYGDRSSVDAKFRTIIGKERPTFQKVILSEDGDSGILADLYAGLAADFEARLEQMKTNISALASGVGDLSGVQDRRFAGHLAGLRPDAIDSLSCWFPQDFLSVSYSPDGQIFRPIEQGSPGQKTAAILAFLLAYGEEPIVLDQPEDDLDNHLIYDLIVRQLQDNKRRRQIIVVTHNANIVVNGDAEMVAALDVRCGQTRIVEQGGLQEQSVRDEICRVMEGGREAFELRYRRMGGGNNV